MAYLNKVHLIGNITRDPEVRYLPSGTAICEFTIAMNRRYSVDGEQREEAIFIDCVAWSKLAEIVGQYVAKGDPVFVEGRLEVQKWDDKQTGQKRSKVRVVADTVQFLKSRDSGASGERNAPRQGSTSQKPAGRKAAPKETPPDEPLDDDDIPF